MCVSPFYSSERIISVVSPKIIHSNELLPNNFSHELLISPNELKVLTG